MALAPRVERTLAASCTFKDFIDYGSTKGWRRIYVQKSCISMFLFTIPQL